MAEEQSKKYKKINDVDYLAEFPGARVAKDSVAVIVEDGEIDVEDDELRQLGVVTVGDIGDTVDVGLRNGQTVEATQGENFVVTDDGNLVVSGLPEPLDVSSSEVDVDVNSQSLSPLTVTDDGNLSIATWNAGTLTVTDDGSLNISGVASIQEDTPLDVSASTVTVQEANPVDTNVNSPPSTKTTENYAADIETDFTATLNVGDYSHVGVSVNTTTNTDILVERSWDQNTWFEVESASSAGKLNQNVQGASGTYYRVTITGTGTTGDTADVVLSAKSM